jgi:ATP-dependent DNA helicase PIF1
MKSVDGHLKDVLFGGKVVVFGGEFRQVLLVVKKGGQEETVRACLMKSHLWPYIHVLKLTLNMRLLKNASATDVHTQTSFANWLLQVGQGTTPGRVTSDASTALSDLLARMVLPSGSTLRQDLPQFTHQHGRQYMIQRAILCSRNEDVKAINKEMMAVIADPARESREYFSADSIVDNDDTLTIQYPAEFLNSIDALSLLPGDAPH